MVAPSLQALRGQVRFSLGEKAFFRNNRFSRTLFESVFVAVCKNVYNNKEMVIQKIDSYSFENLKNDEEFKSYLMSGSSSSENINGRINRSICIIKMK